jgi:fibronectin-binding autotransporter adhesin
MGEIPGVFASSNRAESCLDSACGGAQRTSIISMNQDATSISPQHPPECVRIGGHKPGARRHARSIAWFLGAAALLSGQPTHAADQYWDVNGSATGLGGTGNWTTAATPANWNDSNGTSTPAPWTNGNNAFFTGTAGTVTLVGTTNLAAAAMSIQSTGYVFTNTSTSSRFLTVAGALSLSNNVALTFEISSGTGSGEVRIGSISSGVGSALTIKGGASATNYDRLQITSETTVSVDTTIVPSGSVAGAAIGYYVSVTGAATGVPKAVAITSNITNNSTALFMLGAAVNNTLTYSGKITGTGGVAFTADNAGNGAGAINVTGTASDYTGATMVNASMAGVVTLNSANSTALGATSSITVKQGSLTLGADNQLPNSASVTLAGGTLGTGGFSERGGALAAPTAGAGLLTLTATSTIDFGTGTTSILEFAGLGTHTNGAILRIINWDGVPVTGDGTERLLFAGTSTDFTNLYAQSDVTFNGAAGYMVDQFSGFYEVTAVPEPSTLTAILLGVGLLGWSLRRPT